MIYARDQLVPMDDECWRIFDRHQHEQLRKETERYERTERERVLSAPGFQAQLTRALQQRRELAGMYLTTAMLGPRG